MKKQKLIQVKETPGLARDKQSGAIININKKEISLAKERKLVRQAQKEEHEQLKAEVEALKLGQQQILDLLTKLIEK